MSGTVPASGVLTAANSLTGAQTGDRISSAGLTALTNGNFVVSSPRWKKGPATSAGAATWVSGTTGLIGPVTAENSLTGDQNADSVGGYSGSTDVLHAGRVTALTNGNYVVSSPSWKNGAPATLSFRIQLRGIGKPDPALPFGENPARTATITPQLDGARLVRLPAVAGITYRLERSSDLKNWSFACLVTAGDNGLVTFPDTAPPAGSAFYRLRAR